MECGQSMIKYVLDEMAYELTDDEWSKQYKNSCQPIKLPLNAGNEML